MSTPVENNSTSREYFESVDLGQWYAALVRYAASVRPGNRYFHGPHVAVGQVDLDRVRLGLTWVYDNHAEEIAGHPLPTLAELLAALENPAAASQLSVTDSGSPLHNFWHWING